LANEKWADEQTDDKTFESIWAEDKAVPKQHCKCKTHRALMIQEFPLMAISVSICDFSENIWYDAIVVRVQENKLVKSQFLRTCSNRRHTAGLCLI